MHPSSPAPNRTSSTATPDWRLERGEHGQLDFIDASGRRHTDVDVVRAFPISAAAGPVAIVGTEGDELAWIDPLADLDVPLRSLLEKELSQREFLPVIERIESVSDGEPTEWSVVTVHSGPRRRHRLLTRRRSLCHRRGGRAVSHLERVSSRRPQSPVARPNGLA